MPELRETPVIHRKKTFSRFTFLRNAGKAASALGLGVISAGKTADALDALAPEQDLPEFMADIHAHDAYVRQSKETDLLVTRVPLPDLDSTPLLEPLHLGAALDKIVLAFEREGMSYSQEEAQAFFHEHMPVRFLPRNTGQTNILLRPRSDIFLNDPRNLQLMDKISLFPGEGGSVDQTMGLLAIKATEGKPTVIAPLFGRGLYQAYSLMEIDIDGSLFFFGSAIDIELSDRGNVGIFAVYESGQMSFSPLLAKEDQDKLYDLYYENSSTRRPDEKFPKRAGLGGFALYTEGAMHIFHAGNILLGNLDGYEREIIATLFHRDAKESGGFSNLWGANHRSTRQFHIREDKIAKDLDPNNMDTDWFFRTRTISLHKEKDGNAMFVLTNLPTTPLFDYHSYAVLVEIDAGGKQKSEFFHEKYQLSSDANYFGLGRLGNLSVFIQAQEVALGNPYQYNLFFLDQEQHLLGPYPLRFYNDEFRPEDLVLYAPYTESDNTMRFLNNTGVCVLEITIPSDVSRESILPSAYYLPTEYVDG